jgi:uncharacterized membrane protein
MKKIIYALMFVLFGVLLTSTVYAASFTLNDLEFGSYDQERGQDVSQILHIVNDGNETLDLSLSSSMPSAYDVMFSQSTLSINAGSSADVTVTIFIPSTQSSGRNEVSGGIVVSSTNIAGLSRTARTYVTAVSMLEISKVTITFDDDDHTLRRGDTFDDGLKAGMPITLTVYVRNNFDSSDRVEIQDIEVDVRSSGDLDLDDSDDVGDLDYGDKDSVTFSTDIPSDADDGDDYDIDIEVTGRDENGVWHSDTFSTNIEVSRESHEISITEAKFSSQKVTCGGKVTLNLELENTGKYDEDNVQLEVVSDALDIEKMFYEADMEKDDTARETYTFTLDKDVAQGQYDFVITSFYDVKKESDMQVVTLEVGQCQTQQTTTPTGSTGTTTTGTTTTTTTTQPTVPQVIPITGATPAYGAASFTDSPTYLIILVAAVVVLLLILIILLVKFVF